MREDRWWRRYWRSLGFGREVADELQFHVDLLTKDLVARGMDPATAAREAARRFGDRRRVQADLEEIERRRGRRLRIGLWASELWSDIRYGARGLLKRPGFSNDAPARRPSHEPAILLLDNELNSCHYSCLSRITK